MNFRTEGQAEQRGLKVGSRDLGGTWKKALASPFDGGVLKPNNFLLMVRFLGELSPSLFSARYSGVLRRAQQPPSLVFC